MFRSPATYVPSILKEAGKMLLPHYGNAPTFEHKGNRAPTVVTRFDIETEELIKKRLKEVESVNEKSLYFSYGTTFCGLPAR
jgi:fructose-1,6-bisphosphatase/inositol monophosphatase family enzyme